MRMIQAGLLFMACAATTVVMPQELNDNDPKRLMLGDQTDPFDFENRSLHDDTRTHLERLSMDRIQEAMKGLKKRMSSARKWALGLTVAGLAVTGGVTYWVLRDSNKKPESGKGAKGSAKDTAPFDREKFEQLDKEEQEAHIRLLKAQELDWSTRRDQFEIANNSYKGRFKNIAVGGLALSAAGFALSLAKPLASAISQTLDDAIKAWWHGYDRWFAQETRTFDEEFRALRKSLHQARRVQANYEQQRNMRMSREDLPATYYRDEIIITYQRSIARIERMIALMYLIAPKRHHQAITKQVERQAHIIHRFAASLEHDLNVNTRGFLTHYSNDTLDFFHLLYENIRPFIANFKEFWRR